MDGWICMHRKLLENPIATSPDHIAVWTTLLLLASHKESRFCHGGSWVTLQPGQLLTGREALSRQVGIKRSKLERILKHLETGQQITQHKTNKYRVITIINWHKYQDKAEGGHQAGNKEATDRQQIGTFNNDNNTTTTTTGVNDKKDSKGPPSTETKPLSTEQPPKVFIKPTVAEVKAWVADKGYSVDVEEFFLKYEANGWRVGRKLKPMESWKLTIYRWHVNELRDKQDRKGQGNGSINEQKSSVGTTIQTGV